MGSRGQQHSYCVYIPDQQFLVPRNKAVNRASYQCRWSLDRSELRYMPCQGVVPNMPIRYSISPELNMLMFICKGSVSAAEFFQMADRILGDSRRRTGFITIVDLFSAVEDFHLKDIYEAIRRMEKSSEGGLEPGSVVLLSRSTGIHVLSDTFNLLATKARFKMKAFHTMEDAIKWLNLLDLQQEIIQFRQETISLFEKT